MTARNPIPATDAIMHSGSVPLVRFWFPATFLLCLLLFLTYSPALAEEYLLYQPNPVESDASPQPGEGVLVKKITIRRGATLSALSRQFSGKGAYFPQILLFNKIRNPNLIYAGQDLLVPLSKTLPSQKLQLPSSGMPAKSSARSAARFQKRAISKKSAKKKVPSAERQLYAQATALFAQGNYRKALDGFDRFLEKYPNSTLVPEAILYRGDCFLRLSGS